MNRYALAIVALGASEAAPAAETCTIPPAVQVILNDGHRMVPGGLDPVRRALETELRRVGLELAASTRSVAIHVVILPHDASDWDMAGRTVGAVKRDPGGPASPVFIFYPAAERVLGSRMDRSVTRRRTSGTLWAKGLARIISHEILHVLLPGRPHDAAGLFAQRQTRLALLAREIDLAPETRAELAARLCDLTSPRA